MYLQGDIKMSKVTILENVGKGAELAKRFHLNNVVINKVCNCGEILEYDLGRDYLSYPTVGYPENIYFYCNECGAEYEDSVSVEVQINLVVTEKD